MEDVNYNTGVDSQIKGVMELLDFPNERLMDPFRDDMQSISKELKQKYKDLPLASWGASGSKIGKFMATVTFAKDKRKLDAELKNDIEQTKTQLEKSLEKVPHLRVEFESLFEPVRSCREFRY
jgi:hypothetical protein